MYELPDSIARTYLWKRTLAPQDADPVIERARERLRNAFLQFRDRAKVLAGEIAHHQPDLTVHDISHIDALWGVTDSIIGDSYKITPIEAFVLGGAFLLHDLANGLAVYHAGLNDLRKHPLWIDTLVAVMQSRYGRFPSEQELAHPDQVDVRRAKETLLRDLHAERAQYLASETWQDRDSDVQYFLLEDVELREFYENTIGLIAYSHWWPIDEVEQRLKRVSSPPAGWPNDWRVDELKLACILRVADAAHIDADRAPGFIRAVRHPNEESRRHWVAQERLSQPVADGDRLVYTSGKPFELSDAAAWWTCLDLIRIADRELQQVDDLLVGTDRQRFAVRGVKNADSPLRLAELVKPKGWEPVDAQLHVTSVPELVRKLGGEKLYGEKPIVALRELIQNSSDAVRARRFLEDREDDWGQITVRLGNDAQGSWLEVQDNGLGMTTSVLRGPLLDFGKSYWGTALSRREHPGLIGKGFRPTGNFGIGFFSVFMLGDHVRVITRSYHDASANTRVLEFGQGVSARPILRFASPDEQRAVKDGGTCIRVWLRKDPIGPGGLLYGANGKTRWALKNLCAWLCPSLEVTLFADDGTSASGVAVTASDWMTMDGTELLERITGTEAIEDYGPLMRWFPDWGPVLKPIVDDNNKVLGRACVVPIWVPNSCAVTVGGLRSSNVRGLAGLLVGEASTALRDQARPLVAYETMKAWLSAELVPPSLLEDPDHGEDCASVLRTLGGATHSLPIAFHRDGWLSFSEICNGLWPDEVVLVHASALSQLKRTVPDVTLSPNVIAVGFRPASFGEQDIKLDWFAVPSVFPTGSVLDERSLAGAVAEAIATAWAVPVEKVVKSAQRRNSAFGVAGGLEISDSVIILSKPVSGSNSVDQ